MKPVIGITLSNSYETDDLRLSFEYSRAVEASGALPVFICYTSVSHIGLLLSRLDGVLLSGGVDVDPALYGEEPLPALSEISPLRDGFEPALFKAARQKGLPVLGICRGMQLMAAVEGGSLIQDINTQAPSPLKHVQQAPRYYGTHEILIDKGSKLFSIYKSDRFRVNSFHHQSVKNVPSDYAVTARSSDGVIEAIEHKTDAFTVGVQWHPEMMFEKEGSHALIFTAFAEAAKKYSAKG